MRTDEVLPPLRKASAAVGRDPLEMVGDYRERTPWPRVRFLHTQGKEYLVASLKTREGTVSSIRFILLALDGRALDYVELEGSDALVQITGSFLPQEASDGAVCVMRLSDGGVYPKNYKFGYTLLLADTAPRKVLGKVDCPMEPDREEVCRIAVQNDRWRILKPTLPAAK
jgi:hypothetical protein